MDRKYEEVKRLALTEIKRALLDEALAIMEEDKDFCHGMGENGLTAEDLAVGYGRKILISGIDISLKKGMIITLIGPNGAGKSTILKSISRQISPLGGAVYIGERELREFDGISLAKKMSLMMTGRVDAELMTCEQAVSAGRYPYTGRLGILSPDDRRAVREAMELTDVSAIGDRFISRISDGQRQRVMLARAICQEPEILVLDEPTSFLDIRHKLKLLDILRRLVREKNIGVIMSMHELDMAERISDYVICVGEKGIAAHWAYKKDGYISENDSEMDKWLDKVPSPSYT